MNPIARLKHRIDQIDPLEQDRFGLRSKRTHLLDDAKHNPHDDHGALTADLVLLIICATALVASWIIYANC